MRAILKRDTLNNQIKILFQKYQSGTATTKERELVEKWYDSLSGPSGEKEEIDVTVNKEIDPAIFKDLDARVLAMLQDTNKTRKLNYSWLQIAAALLFTIGAGFYIRHQYAPKSQPAETFAEIKAVKGFKKEVTLSDGTTVFLNSGSSVYVSSRFGQQNRTVKLSGEAFFQVHHDKTKPFIIHTGKLATTVLGTSFDINAYPEDDLVKITVATGRVKVNGTGKNGKTDLLTQDLSHNQALVYNKIRNTHLIKASSADSISSWRSNHLIFENATNAEIARTLSRWYGIEVVLDADGSDHKRYTLSFHNEKADKVLGVLSALTGMSYTMQGKKVIITPIKYK